MFCSLAEANTSQIVRTTQALGRKAGIGELKTAWQDHFLPRSLLQTGDTGHHGSGRCTDSGESTSASPISAAACGLWSR